MYLSIYSTYADILPMHIVYLHPGIVPTQYIVYMSVEHDDNDLTMNANEWGQKTADLRVTN